MRIFQWNMQIRGTYEWQSWQKLGGNWPPGGPQGLRGKGPLCISSLRPPATTRSQWGPQDTPSLRLWYASFRRSLHMHSPTLERVIVQGPDLGPFRSVCFWGTGLNNGEPNWFCLGWLVVFCTEFCNSLCSWRHYYEHINIYTVLGWNKYSRK